MDEPREATMNIEIDYTHNEMIIPAGCRKARPVEHTGIAIAIVREVTAEQAPIGIRTPDNDYRWFEGQLYTPKVISTYREADRRIRAWSPDFTGKGHHVEYGEHTDESVTIGNAIAQYANHLIIDGDVFTVAQEPVYSYSTYGYDRTPHLSIGHYASGRSYAARDRQLAIDTIALDCRDNARDGDMDADARIKIVMESPVIEVFIDDAATFVTPSNFAYWTERWESYLTNLRAGVVLALGRDDDTVQAIVPDALDYLVGTYGEWGAVRRLRGGLDHLTDRWREYNPDTITEALAAVGATGGDLTRSILTVELLHEGELADVQAILRKALGRDVLLAVTNAAEHSVPKRLAESERARLG